MLTGIFPPIATPFQNDKIAYGKLEENIHTWNKTALSGYVVMGSNGESAFLTFEEKLKLIQAVHNSKTPDKLLIAGTGSDSIADTIALTNAAAANGADYALVLTPSFFKGQMKPENFIRYFTSVADKTTIPLIIYNVPKFTGVSIEADTVARLAEHENITGMKNSTTDIAHITEVIHKSPVGFSNLVGTASVLFPGFCVGAAGGVVALANIAPEECIRIKTLFDGGEIQKSLELQQRMLPVNKAVTATYGVPGLKAAMDMTGYFGGKPRLPLTSLSSDDKADLKNILIKAQLIC